MSTTNLIRPEQRAYNSYQRKKQREREELMACLHLMMEEVHPANWSVLPPSPKQLILKATVMGVKPDHVNVFDYLPQSV